mmetsp:Transcript_46926/g.133413  ORF Transcript_46926/g.133413 Transcript_46926/m.133413 type:complete len:230 (-) Transcript_46926:598-1287(-)
MDLATRGAEGSAIHCGGRRGHGVGGAGRRGDELEVRGVEGHPRHGVLRNLKADAHPSVAHVRGLHREDLAAVLRLAPQLYQVTRLQRLASAVRRGPLRLARRILRQPRGRVPDGLPMHCAWVNRRRAVRGLEVGRRHDHHGVRALKLDADRSTAELMSLDDERFAEIRRALRDALHPHALARPERGRHGSWRGKYWLVDPRLHYLSLAEVLWLSPCGNWHGLPWVHLRS